MNKAMLLAACAAFVAPVAAQAQTQDVRHPKPVHSRTYCSSTDIAYRLVAIQGPTGYRAVNAAMPGGYDPGAAYDQCGPVAAAQPLVCVDGSGTPAADQDACEPRARAEFEIDTMSKVYRNAAAGMLYYTVDTKNIGVATATGVRITKSGSPNCMWIKEIEVAAQGRNVALSASGSTIASSPPLAGWSQASQAVDGNRTGNGFISSCNKDDYLTVTFAKQEYVESITIYGQTGWEGNRDNTYTYELLNGAAVVARGVIDARNDPWIATVKPTNLPGCSAGSFSWKTSSDAPSNICGTQTVPVVSTCVDGSGTTIADSLCDAGSRPAATRTVTSSDGCVADYQTTAWSTAAPTCGNVVQTRTVTCVGADGKDMGDTTCALRLTPPEGRDPAQIADAEYWSKGVYAWPNVSNARIWRMPTACDVASSPGEVAKECQLVYVSKTGVNQPYLRPLASRTVEDRRACQSEAGASYHWNDPTYVPDKVGMCGTNTRTGVVKCLDGSGAQVADSLCDAASKPPATQTFEDRSGCIGSDQTGVQIAQIQLGTCNATSGGGRYACGPRGNYRNGPTAPWPNELCSGKLVYGNVDGNYVGDPDYGTTSTKGWATPPKLLKVPGARCVVHWKVGYSDSPYPGWVSAYYDGGPTGKQGGMFIGR